MAKKVKCIECDNSMDWSIPRAEEIKGNDFLLDTLKNTIACGYTMKTKNKDHCQYCKHYERTGDFRKKCRDLYEKKLNETLKEIHSEVEG